MRQLLNRQLDAALPWLIAVGLLAVLLYALWKPCCCQAQCTNGRCLPTMVKKEPTRKPVPRPAPIDDETGKSAEPVFGVDADKLTGSDSYTLHTAAGCHHLTKEAAQAVVGQQLQDDSNKLRITVIGSDAACRLALADLSKVPDLQTWAIVRGYQPGHWALEPGFVQTGTPSIYCQAPGGKVLHRQDDYQGGGPDLVDALRKAKAGYDPKKDPDLRKSQVNDPPNNPIATCCLALAAGAGLSYVLRPKKG